MLSTALYNIWASSKQKTLETGPPVGPQTCALALDPLCSPRPSPAGSSQLVHQFSPYAALMLAALVPVAEPVGWQTRAADTLLGCAIR